VLRKEMFQKYFFFISKPLPIVKTEKWVVFGGLACKHFRHHGFIIAAKTSCRIP
jgi:hypothetical protein